jgi:transcription initiation factor IIE alpha subunit
MTTTNQITKLSDTITSGQAKVIIDLLTEIKEVLEEIRDKEPEENEEETYTCDGCNEEATGEPHKQINRFTFCSDDCANDWENDTEN